ncbi:hypothetical protein ABZP36_003999 [Zizania latifolia]
MGPSTWAPLCSQTNTEKSGKQLTPDKSLVLFRRFVLHAFVSSADRRLIAGEGLGRAALADWKEVTPCRLGFPYSCLVGSVPGSYGMHFGCMGGNRWWLS